MTTEVNDNGPAQVGTVDDAVRVAAAKEGISMPPKEGEVAADETNVDPNALPSDKDGKVEDDGAPKRPENIPEKFWKDGKLDTEALLASYQELEKGKGGGQQEQKAPEANDGSKPPENDAGKQANDIVTKAGLDWATLNTEWQKGGKLSDASYAAFKAQGIDQAMVDGYINGQNAIAQASVNIIRNAAFTEAGGEAKYMEAITWAKDGLAAGEIAAFDKAVTGNDPAAAKVAVRSLMAAFAKAGGAEPTNLATGGTNGTGGTYTSVEQMLVDMNDPRYASDPAFRKRVEQKVARSNI